MPRNVPPKGNARDRVLKAAEERVSPTAPRPPQTGEDRRKVQTLVGSFFVRKEGGIAREFEISADVGGSISLGYYNQLLAPLGITMSLGNFGLSLTGADGKTPEGITLTDRLVSRSGHTPRFAAIMVMDEETYMRVSAACEYNALSKLSSGQRERWEAVKKEFGPKKEGAGQGGGQASLP